MSETVALAGGKWDAIETIPEDRAEDERFGAVPTNKSVAAEQLRREIREQRGGGCDD